MAKGMIFQRSGKCHVWGHKNLKRRIATRSGKGIQPLNIKTAVEWPILKLGYPNLRWSFYSILLLVASLLFRRIFMTSHMTLSSLFHNSFLFFLISRDFPGGIPETNINRTFYCLKSYNCCIIALKEILAYDA